MLETERVRVLEVPGKPSDKTELHSHPARVAIAISDSEFKFTSADSQSMEGALKAGQTMYLDPVEHTTEITGSTKAHVLLVELK